MKNLKCYLLICLCLFFGSTLTAMEIKVKQNQSCSMSSGVTMHINCAEENECQGELINQMEIPAVSIDLEGYFGKSDYGTENDGYFMSRIDRPDYVYFMGTGKSGIKVVTLFYDNEEIHKFRCK